MKSTVETLGPTRVRLAVEVPFEELKPSFDAAYKKIGAQVRIPGFRPGKAPARIIDQRVGRAVVLEEAVNSALPQAYGDAVRANGVRVLGQPDIEVTSLDDGKQLAFTAEVDIRPDVPLPALTGIAIEVDDVTVSDEEVDAELDALRERFATLTGVERAVAERRLRSYRHRRPDRRSRGRRRVSLEPVLRGGQRRSHRRSRRGDYRHERRRFGDVRHHVAVR